MPTFKRNQVEEAIARAVEPTTDKPSAELLNRLKRLLDTDRGLGRRARSTDPEKATYAFFSQDAAGSGIEVRFQEYEAFALLIGWRFLDHGFPQQKAVSALRRIRPVLEQEHARIMQLDRDTLFNQQQIRAAAKPGQLYLNNTAPVFLVICSGEDDFTKKDDRSIKSVTICRSELELMQLIKSHFGLNTIFELVGTAHFLRDSLLRTQPTQRGRPSQTKITDKHAPGGRAGGRYLRCD
jgi:hypothetical protein